MLVACLGLNTNSFPNENIFFENNSNFAKNEYLVNNEDYNYYFYVDKFSCKMYQINLDNNSFEYLGEVGIGKNIGDRDVSRGRNSDVGSFKTQSGWVKITRYSHLFSKRNIEYGDRFYGFSAYVDNEWKEIPTGIHGTEKESYGRVSKGCTRCNESLEDYLEDYLDKGVLFYYSSDK